MATPEQIGWAIRTLQKRAQELGYPPKKADFDDATRARISFPDKSGQGILFKIGYGTGVEPKLLSVFFHHL